LIKPKIQPKNSVCLLLFLKKKLVLVRSKTEPLRTKVVQFSVFTFKVQRTKETNQNIIYSPILNGSTQHITSPSNSLFLRPTLWYALSSQTQMVTCFLTKISLPAPDVSFIPLKNSILPLIKNSVRRNRNFSNSNVRKNLVSRNQSCILKQKKFNL
jgi:hypothetical protein